MKSGQKGHFHVSMHLQLTFFCNPIHYGLDVTFCRKKNIRFISKGCFEIQVLVCIASDYYSTFKMGHRCTCMLHRSKTKIWKRKRPLCHISHSNNNVRKVSNQLHHVNQIQYKTKHVLMSATQFIPPKRSSYFSYSIIFYENCMFKPEAPDVV